MKTIPFLLIALFALSGGYAKSHQADAPTCGYDISQNPQIGLVNYLKSLNLFSEENFDVRILNDHRVERTLSLIQGCLNSVLRKRGSNFDLTQYINVANVR